MRIALFILVNILVMASLSLVSSLFGISGYLKAYGIDYASLMIFCLFWGMGGSFISLLLSKYTAKLFMGVEIIDETNTKYRPLFEMVRKMSDSAGIKMPEVGIYESPELNAFATGSSKNNSLVALSTGLLNHMDKKQIEGVIGHEIAHIANGDMVTMTLIQGVVNAFVMFLSRIAAFALAQSLSNKDDNRSSNSFLQMGLIFIFDIIFGILAAPIVAWFSRYREYRADALGAQFAGKQQMISALKALQYNYSQKHNDDSNELKTMKIFSKKSLLGLFSSHPPLEERIKRLEQHL